MKKKRLKKNSPFFNCLVKFSLILLAFMFYKNSIFSQISKLPKPDNQQKTQNFCMALEITGEFTQILASDNDNKSNLFNLPNNNYRIDKIGSNTDYLLVQNSKNKLESYSILGKTKMWELDLESKISSALINSSNHLIILLKNNQGEFFIRSIDLNTGLPTKTSKISLPSDFKLKISNERTYFYQSKEMPEIYLIEPESEEIIKIENPEKYEFLEENTGDKQQLVVNGNVISGDGNGNILARNKQNNLLWSMRVGGAITDLITSGKNLYVSSKDNFIYSLIAHSGKIKWKYRLEGRTNHKNFLLGDSLLIFQSSESAIIVLDKLNGKLQNIIKMPKQAGINSQPVINNGIIYLPTDTGIYSLKNCSAQTK